MPTLIRQVWNTYGTTGADAALWRAANPPVDPYKTMVDGISATAGQTMRQVEQASGGVNALWAFSEGGALDTTRKKWVGLCSTGHFSGGTNEVIEFDMTAATWSRPVDPTVELFILMGQSSDGQGNQWPANMVYAGLQRTAPLAVLDINNHYPSNVLPASLGNGLHWYPISRQIYDGVCFMENVGRFWIYGGFCYWDAISGSAKMIFEYDPVAKKYQIQDAEGLVGLGTFPGCCYDSTYGRVVFTDASTLYAYYPTATAGHRVLPLTFQDGPTGGSADEVTMLWDAKRKRAWLFGGRSNNRYYDFSGGASGQPPFTTFTPTGVGAGAFRGLLPGVALDTVRDRAVATVGGRSLYTMNLDTFATTDITPSTGATPSFSDIQNNSPQVQNPTGQGVGKRFCYVPGLDFYWIAPLPSDASTFVFVPQATLGLLASDLASGPRTGNGDTSFGQVTNQDGAYVTVVGIGIGTFADTVTCTINGAPALIVSRGAANSLPANLVNGYQSYSYLIAQVNHAASDGAGTIVVTVNGQQANTLPFTVAPGTIRFAASGGNGNGTWGSPFGSIQNLLNSLGAGDIGYVRSGLDATGGIVLLQNVVGLANPAALCAYPNATPTLGDANHAACQQGASGSGANLVYSKFNMVAGNDPFSGSQGLTLTGYNRVFGCKFTAPNGSGASGTVGASGNNIYMFCNEATTCGANTDSLYHVFYFGGRRGVSDPTPQTTREVAYCYFHQNKAARAVNCFNEQGTGNDPIGDHYVHHNVFVDQQWAAIGFQRGCVGHNRAEYNLIINCGLGTYDPAGQLVAFHIAAGYPFDFPPTAPITITLQHNTVLNSGDTAGADRGVFEFTSTAQYTLEVKDNILYQPNGVRYVSPNSDAIPTAPSLRSNNLFFGAGAAPSWSASGLNENPLIVSSVPTYDLHLTSTSHCIGAGTSPSVAAVDFDGQTVTAGTPSDIGAYQFFGGPSAPPVNPSVITLTWNGKVRDRVGQGSFALGADGSLDGVITAAWSGGSDTVTRIRITSSSGGIWDTLQPNAGQNWLAGVAQSIDGASINDPTTMAVNFAAQAGDSFVCFISDVQGLGPLDLVPGVTVTITATLLSGGSTVGSVVIPSGAPPTISSLSPTSVIAGSGQFTLTINGTNFDSAATVQWNGVNRASVFVSASQMTATILASDVASQGTATVTVTNPGNVVSNGQTFTITAAPPSPALSSISPSSIQAGSAQFTLTVTGTNFVSGAFVRWNGSNRSTTFVSATSLTATILNTDVASAGTATVTVINPNAAVSNGQTFTINAIPQTPHISQVFPPSGMPASTVTVTGSNFGPSQGASSIHLGATVITVASWSDQQITFAVPALQPAIYQVGVTTAAGVSNTMPFEVLGTPPPVPAITSISPSSVSPGGLVTILGTNFGAVQGTSRVIIGTLPGVVATWVDTAISFRPSTKITPSTWDVKVTTTTGTSNIVRLTITGTPPAGGVSSQGNRGHTLSPTARNNANIIAQVSNWQGPLAKSPPMDTGAAV